MTKLTKQQREGRLGELSDERKMLEFQIVILEKKIADIAHETAVHKSLMNDSYYTDQCKP